MIVENEGESLLDALNAGLPTGDEAEETETPEGEEEEAVEGEETETPEGEEEETPEGEEEEAEGEEGEEEDPEAAAAAAKAAKKPAKEPDPVNDPLPKGTQPSTTERFKHVVDKLKEQTTRADTSVAQYDELTGLITGAGMDGTTFNAMLEYANGVNGGTWEGLERSYDFLMQELAALSKALGRPLPGHNPLDGHADLVKEVDEKKITPERAVEIAKQRNRDSAKTKFDTSRTGAAQTETQRKNAEAAGRTAMTALGRELATKDGLVEYRRKAGLVVGMLQETLPNLPPKLWVKAFRAAYDKVPAAPKAAKIPPKPGTKPQPMRGNKRPAGDSSKKPKNLREAINGAFES